MAAVTQKPWAVPGASLQSSGSPETRRLSFAAATKNGASCTLKVRPSPHVPAAHSRYAYSHTCLSFAAATRMAPAAHARYAHPHTCQLEPAPQPPTKMWWLPECTTPAPPKTKAPHSPSLLGIQEGEGYP